MYCFGCLDPADCCGPVRGLGYSYTRYNVAYLKKVNIVIRNQHCTVFIVGVVFVSVHPVTGLYLGRHSRHLSLSLSAMSSGAVSRSLSFLLLSVSFMLLLLLLLSLVLLLLLLLLYLLLPSLLFFLATVIVVVIIRPYCCYCCC